MRSAASFGYHRNVEAAVTEQMGQSLAIAFVVQLLVAIGLRYWARALAARAGSWWRWVQRLPMIGLVLIVCGLAGTVIGLVRAFAAVSHVDPSQKATLLAASIAEAMNSTAFIALPGVLLYVATATCCLIYTFRPARVS
jgi:hypothetical protein